MGNGISQVCAQAGYEVKMRDIDQKFIDKGIATIKKNLERGLKKGRITQEAKNKEELLKKEFGGERNVLTTRIESLEKTVKEQGEHITRLSGQMEQSYQKVQDIAVKAIEGSSNLQSLTSLQQMVTDQTRKQSQEK